MANSQAFAALADDGGLAIDARLAQAVAEAVRNTARVRFLRRAIVLGLATTFVGAVAFLALDPFRDAAHGEAVNLDGLKGGRVTMDAPRLTGFRRDLKPYEVTAKSASQDVKSINTIDLDGLEARLDMSAHGLAKITAKTGQFDSAKEVMTLQERVRLNAASGMELQLNSATIDMKSGNLVSQDKARVLTPTGSIDADRMSVSEQGKAMTFTGRVKTIMQSEDSAAAASGALKGAR